MIEPLLAVTYCLGQPPSMSVAAALLLAAAVFGAAVVGGLAVAGAGFAVVCAKTPGPLGTDGRSRLTIVSIATDGRGR